MDQDTVKRSIVEFDDTYEVNETPGSIEYNEITITVNDNYVASCETYDADEGKKYYSCSYCSYRCPRKSSFIIHTRVHTGEKPFPCNLCEYRCRSRATLMRHMRSHSGEKPFACTYCDFKCSLKNNLNVHMRSHTGEKPYACAQCAYKCAQRSTLVTHMSKHTGHRPYTCTFCDYKTAYKSHLVGHMRTHTGEKPYQCGVCGYKCAISSALSLHMVGHNNEKKFICSYCDYKCKRKSEINDHLRIHTGEKPFACNMCEFSCSRSNILTNHMKTHSGEKPFSCHHCQYKCVQRSTLVNHMRTHTGEKPYKCKLCKFKCSKGSNLTSHIRSHTGEKPYKCNMCNFTTKTKTHLNTHVQRTHARKPKSVNVSKTSESVKTYVCSVCDFKTTKTPLWQRHFRTHVNKSEVGSPTAFASPVVSVGDAKTVGRSKACECSVCGYKAMDETDLDRHSKNHVKVYTCDICYKECPNECSLAAHECKGGAQSHSLKTELNATVVESHFVEVKQEFGVLDQDFSDSKTQIDSHTDFKQEVDDSCEGDHLVDTPATIAYVSVTPEYKGHSEACNKPTNAWPQMKSVPPDLKPQISLNGNHFDKLNRLNDSAPNTKLNTVKEPYTCDVCCAKFARVIDLCIHMRLHMQSWLGKKLCCCEHCMYKSEFSEQADLKTHVCRHTGVKPFTCFNSVGAHS